MSLWRAKSSTWISAMVRVTPGPTRASTMIECVHGRRVNMTEVTECNTHLITQVHAKIQSKPEVILV